MMDDKESVRRGLKTKKITQEEFAKLIGYNGQGSIGRMLNRENGMRTDVFKRMMDALGYDIIIRDRDGNEEWNLDMKPEPKLMQKQKESKARAWKYYSPERPIAPGTCPKKGLKEVVNYDDRKMTDKGYAWGHAWYDRELSESECEEYELVFAQEISFSFSELTDK